MVRYKYNLKKPKKKRRLRLARKRLFILAAFILLAGIFVVGLRVLSPYRGIQNTSDWAMSLRESPQDRGINYLLYGLREKEDGVVIEEMFLLNFFSPEEKPHVVFIPGALLMQRLEENTAPLAECEDQVDGTVSELFPYYLPGNYYDEGGSRLFLEQLPLFLDIPVHYFLEINYEGLPALVDELGGASLNEAVLSGEEYLNTFLEKGEEESSLERGRRRARALQKLAVRAMDEGGLFATSSMLRKVSPYLDTNLEWNELEDLGSRLDGLFDPSHFIVDLPGEWEAFNAEKYFKPEAPLVTALMKNLGEDFVLPRELVRVEVLNGCGIAGAAGRVGEYLAEEGFQIVNVDDADSFDYERSQVISRLEEMEMAREVAALIPGAELLREPLPDPPAMVTVIVGKNYPI